MQSASTTAGSSSSSSTLPRQSHTENLHESGGYRECSVQKSDVEQSKCCAEESSSHGPQHNSECLPHAPVEDAGARGGLGPGCRILQACAALEQYRGNDVPPVHILPTLPLQRGDSESEERPNLFFQRRSPDEYSRPVVKQSSLTACFRKQFGSFGESDVTIASVSSSMSQLSHADSTRRVEIRMWLPPYSGEPLVLNVPMTQLVADLRDDVVRQHASDAGLAAFAAYELRFYDDDEQEPDYDCAPFDESLQIGCLNIKEMALCQVVANVSSTPMSPPLASPDRDGDLVGGKTPDAIGSGLLARKVSEAIGKQSKSGIKFATHPGIVAQPILITRTVLDDQTPCVTIEKDPPLREDSDSSEVFSAFELPPRKDSMDSSTTVELNKEHKTHLRPRKASDPVRFAEDLPVEKETNACQRKPLGRAKSTPQMVSETGEPLITFGGFDAVSGTGASGLLNKSMLSKTCTLPLNSRMLSKTLGTLPTMNADFSRESSAGTSVGPEVTRQLDLLLPRGWPAFDDHAASLSLLNPDGELFSGSGETFSLHVREDATLEEVLSRLSHERGTPYDTVNFAFERIDDGIKHRMDLHTQVKHLQPHKNVLMVVRKDWQDTPMTLGPPGTDRLISRGTSGEDSPKRHQNLDMLHQRTPMSTTFYSEYQAAISAEYMVTVTRKCQQSSRTPRATACNLTVERDRMAHRPPRTSSGNSSSSEDCCEKRRGGTSAFVQPLLRMRSRLGKHLRDFTEADPPPGVLAERRVQTIREIKCDFKVPGRCFSVVYLDSPKSENNNDSVSSISGGDGSEVRHVELLYEAQTPTECAEIVARLQFLKSVLK